MRQPPFHTALVFASVLLLKISISAQDEAEGLLVPWKDELFASPRVIESRDDGAYLILDYQSKRDINGRDTIPEKKAKEERVSTETEAYQRDLELKTKYGKVPHIVVGHTAKASVIVLFLHGKGGSRTQGVDDWTFGGNFNRLENLVVRSGGLYISSDFGSFTGRGAKQVDELLRHYIARSPGAPVIISAASAGGRICYQLARRDELVPYLDGIVLLGSFPDSPFLGSRAWKEKIPIYIGHGSGDWVSYIHKMEDLYRRIRASDPSYPIRMERFETGTHGTPMRMIDWRKTINWMLSVERP